MTSIGKAEKMALLPIFVAMHALPEDLTRLPPGGEFARKVDEKAVSLGSGLSCQCV